MENVDDARMHNTRDNEDSSQLGSTNGETNPKEEEDLRTRRIDSKLGWGLYADVKDANEWFSIMGRLGLIKSPTELDRCDLVGKDFGSLEEAETFFMIYSRAVGFGVRKGQKLRTQNGNVKNRTWLCCKEGHRHKKFFVMENRKKEPKAITREGCKVKFRVNLCTEKNQWIVKEFYTHHSHILAKPTHVQFMPSNRVVSDGAMQTAKAMKSAGVKTCSIMSYFADQVGGYDNVRFTIKDLYNRLGRQQTTEVGDCDAAAAIGYLQYKSDQDINFFGKYSFDDSSRLENMLWADGQCRQDYIHFGDVLSFDTTYKTNDYGKPLLVFVGINHHFRTTIFGFALLKNETVETYIWALRTFLECMKEKTPTTVITDGDLAIKSALTNVMPEAVHRLCSWHIEHNAITNVKKSGFVGALKRMMFRHYSADEFDEEWNRMINEFGLQGNSWVDDIYSRRQTWADTFLRGHFFGGMTTTQRCEKMHSFLKSKIHSKIKLCEFVRGMNNAVRYLRHKESQDEYKTLSTKPVLELTNMPHVEADAASIYSRRIFFLVRDEIKKEGKYITTGLEDAGDTIICRLIKYGGAMRHRQIIAKKTDMTFSCPCRTLTTKGIPCRHIFAAMKAMQLKNLPTSIVLRRWTRNAKVPVGGGVTTGLPWNNILKDGGARFGHITGKCSEIAFFASQSDQLFAKAVHDLDHLTTTLRAMYEPMHRNNLEETPQKQDPTHNVKNPENTRCKGGWSGSSKRSSHKKHCRICHNPGHNKATCNARNNKGKRAMESEDEGQTGLESSQTTRTNACGSVLEQSQATGVSTRSNDNESMLQTGVDNVNRQNEVSDGGRSNVDMNNDISRNGHFWWGAPY